MALDSITDKTQQPPAATEGGSLYDQIMSGPPGGAAPETAVTTTATDGPPAPGAASPHLDRSVAPAQDKVVAPAEGDKPVVPTDTASKDAPALVPAENGDMPVAPGASTETATTEAKDAVVPAPNGDKPVAPGLSGVVVENNGALPRDAAPVVDPQVAPFDANFNKVPGAPGAAPVEGVEDMGNPNFRPDYEYKTEQGRAWKAVSDQQRLKPIELNERGRYTVQHGDCLETIAERNLKGSGLPANRMAIKAEVAEIVAANQHRYPSLAANSEFIKGGWTLTLPQHRPGEAPREAPLPQPPVIDRAVPQPQLPPSVERPPVDRPPVHRQPAVEVIPPPQATLNHRGGGNVYINQAGTVNVYGRSDAPRAIPSSQPYYTPDTGYYPQDVPVYNPEPVVYAPEPRFRRPPVVIDARVDVGHHGGWNRGGWDRGSSLPPWVNDGCFPGNRGYETCDNGNGWRPDRRGWRNDPRVSFDLEYDSRRLSRSMPHMGRPGPYWGNGGRNHGFRGGSGISVSFRI